MRMIKKYLKKDIHLQKKEKTFFDLRLKLYNNGISKNHKSFKEFTIR